MHERRIPEWLRHSPTPSIRGFATLAGFEAVARGILISVYPLIMYRALGDAGMVSAVYFVLGVASAAVGFLVPWISRHIPRRWVYSAGVSGFLIGAALGAVGSPAAIVAALAAHMIATVVTFVCFNAYVLDYIARSELGQCETQRMFYSALGWTAGPMVGVVLLELWPPAPFLVAGIAAALMLVQFWRLRMGNGRQIARARAQALNPLAYIPRFLLQPRLVSGYLFALVRSCGWWVYVVYLPIFAVESGLGDQLGGTLLSFTNGALFLSPVIRLWTRRQSLRHSVRTGFLGAGLLFLFAGATAAEGQPQMAIAALVLGSLMLILLDLCGGLPFLMAVKPSERTEMSAIYSSYRDVSGIVTPGAAWAVLAVAPLWGIFVAGGVALLGAWTVAGRLHPRLGQPRPALSRNPG